MTYRANQMPMLHDMMTVELTQTKLEEMVRDMTIGAGEDDLSNTILVQRIEGRTGRKLNVVQCRIVQRANQECQSQMANP